MKFAVTILGSNSAFPAFGRFPSAQIINFNESLFLVDCGEGTQIQMSRFRVRRNRIDHIFISHLHGDHVYGLPGLLTSFAQLSRKAPLHITGPKGIRELIDTTLKLSQARTGFDILFTELSEDHRETVLKTTDLHVTAFPLHHRVKTYGYLFEEQPGPLNVRKECIDAFQLTREQILDLKSGQDILLNGKKIPAGEMTLPPEPPRAYAYCSDTAYSDKVLAYIKGVQVLYHETTFMDDLEELAAFSKHSTTRQAAQIAQLAEAGALITGHYSSRYRDLGPLLEETRSIFPSTYLGLEGRTYYIGPLGVAHVEEAHRN